MIRKACHIGTKEHSCFFSWLTCPQKPCKFASYTKLGNDVQHRFTCLFCSYLVRCLYILPILVESKHTNVSLFWGISIIAIHCLGWCHIISSGRRWRPNQGEGDWGLFLSLDGGWLDVHWNWSSPIPPLKGVYILNFEYLGICRVYTGG